MMQIQFKLILNPKRGQFEFTVGQDATLLIKGPMWDTKAPMRKKWLMTAIETEQFIQKARNQLVDVTDTSTEFVLEPGDYKINLKGITSRDAFQQIVEYLEKVWDSFKGSAYYAKIYPQ